MTQMRIFALHTSRDLAEKVCESLGVRLSEHEERSFEDGEYKVRPLESVRGCDVFVIQRLHGDATESVDEKLCRLLFFVGALRDAAAAQVTAVVPYLCYARKDRKTKPRDPVTTRYVAELFEAVGTDRVVTIDVHNLAAFQNAFRIPTEHLEARHLLADHLASELESEDVVVVSPDAGGFKRAEQFRAALERRLQRSVEMAFMEKQRSGGVVSGDALVGAVAGKTALLVDDLISSGTTLSRAAAACQAHGARRALAAATHGLFVGMASSAVTALERVVVTDSVPPYRLSPVVAESRLAVLPVAPLLAEAIRRLHEDRSLVEIMAT